MQISAQPRFTDHAARTMYGRQVRRVSDESGGSGRSHERANDERRRPNARPRPPVSEPVSAALAAPPRAETLWSLVAAVGGNAAEGRPATAPAIEPAPVSRAESLYLLLSQVVGDV